MYGKITIRRIIADMRKIGAHVIYFHGYKEAINVLYGKPGDRYCEYSYSHWKHINGTDICRNIHCTIPEVFRIPEIEKYGIDGEYVLPERIFNLLLNCFRFDYGRSISDPYYMYVDMMEMAEW